MIDFGVCPRCGETLRSPRETVDGFPGCANECRTRHKREYDTARYTAMVAEMRGLMSAEPYEPPRRRGMSRLVHG